MPAHFLFDLLCAFDLIDTNFMNFNECMDYRSMASGSETLHPLQKPTGYRGNESGCSKFKFFMKLCSLILILMVVGAIGGPLRGLRRPLGSLRALPGSSWGAFDNVL